MIDKIRENLLLGSPNTFCIDGNKNYTWREAKDAVTILTDFLLEKKLKPGSIVGIDANKDFFTYVSILACYCHGITFVPVDLASLSNASNKISSIKVDLYLTSVIKNADLENDIFYLRELIDNKYCKKSALFFDNFNLHGAAYIMRSSGSTGRPKIIPISYNNLHTYLAAITKVANFKVNSVFSQIVALTFDLSIHDIFLSFLHNGTILPLQASFSKIAHRFIAQFGVDNIMLVPSFCDILIESNVILPSVQNIFFCGEALRRTTAISATKIFPNACMYNLYGPTEATIAISCFELSKDVIPQDQIVPIGTPLDGSYFILDEDGNLLLGGSQIFSGYLNSDAKEPFTVLNGMRLYKSGDICAFKDGNYHFISRSDFQIKYRGYRLELEGIEALLGNNFPGQFGVVGTKEISSNNFYELNIFYDNNEISELNLIEGLPSHLRSAKLKLVPEIPRNHNGKINRHKLKELV